jgi:hypothetical protein
MRHTKIRIVSRLPYFGNTGSGSVPGYYTVWETRINQYGYIDIMKPKQIKQNQNMEDLKKYRGKLYVIQDGSKVRGISIKNCCRCKELSIILDGMEMCGHCYDLDLYGGK